jgi:hypothetical protein
VGSGGTRGSPDRGGLTGCGTPAAVWYTRGCGEWGGDSPGGGVARFTAGTDATAAVPRTGPEPAAGLGRGGWTGGSASTAGCCGVGGAGTLGGAGRGGAGRGGAGRGGAGRGGAGSGAAGWAAGAWAVPSVADGRPIGTDAVARTRSGVGWTVPVRDWLGCSGGDWLAGSVRGLPACPVAGG